MSTYPSSSIALGETASKVQNSLRAFQIILEHCLRVDVLNEKSENHYYRILNRAQLEAKSGSDSSIVNFSCKRLTANGHLYKNKQGDECLKLSILEPVRFVLACLDDAVIPTELHYLIKKYLRQQACLPFGPDAARVFGVCSSAIGEMFEKGSLEDKTMPSSGARLNPSKTTHEQEQTEILRVIYLDARMHLLDRLSQNAIDTKYCDYLVDVFFTECLWLGFASLDRHVGSLRWRTRIPDTDYLISILYGLPTSIPGLDELFGGGGLILQESLPASAFRAVPGRTAVISGRFATGKSLLALQLASEVARKGGAAIVFALEQNSNEVLYTIESMGLAKPGIDILVSTDISATHKLLAKGPGEKGIIAVMRMEKERYSDFLNAVDAVDAYLSDFPLRVIVVDSINSIPRGARRDSVQLRAETLNSLAKIRAGGTNIVLTIEEGTGMTSDLLSNEDATIFEHKIADTVIRLSVEPRFNYSQRYFEITKSRLQREQRGQHPMAIQSGKGFVIYPSSAAVAARTRQRTQIRNRTPIEFGLDDLWTKLPPGSLLRGDTIAINGPSSTHKTLLALYFVTFREKPSSTPAVGVYVGSSEAVEAAKTAAQAFRLGPSEERLAIVYISIPMGFIQPGYVFQSIGDCYADLREKGIAVSRIVIDDVAGWEDACPFLKSDETFGGTLVRYLRRRESTSMLVLDDSDTRSDSALQRAILRNSDVRIKTSKLSFHGQTLVVGNILRSNGDSYLTEPFEIRVNGNRMEIGSRAALLRVDKSGEVQSIPVGLYLHSETIAQESYNAAVKIRLSAAFGKDIAVSSEAPLVTHYASPLGAVFVKDEMQILQIDECQLPTSPGGRACSLSLAARQRNPRGEDSSSSESDHKAIPRLENFRDKAERSGYTIEPLYVNVDMLAHIPRDGVTLSGEETWSMLAELSVEWFKRLGENAPLFFDFPKATFENINCLFLEIVFELYPDALVLKSERTTLLDILPEQAFVAASQVFRILCRTAFLRNKCSVLGRTTSGILPDVDRNAVVWRHWFTTLQQMCSKMSTDEFNELRIYPVPGSISIAGEWYLAVPSQATAQAVAFDIIDSLVSRSAELERLDLGVGLPTRNDFYVKQDRMCFVSCSGHRKPLPAKVIDCVVRPSFSRSLVHYYSSCSPILANTLERVLVNDMHGKDEEKTMCISLYKELKSRIQFITEA